MPTAVEVNDLTKRYGDHLAVDSVSLRVEAGEVYGFLGPNGAGKTTTLRMALGLIRPTSGSVRALGAPPGAPATLRRIGSMVESPAFYPYLGGRDNLRALARYAGVGTRAVDAALDRVGLAGRARDPFGQYSLGMKQRLGVAAALMRDPELVILDEPTNGLDPAGMRDMRRLIADLGEEGRTVLLSSHLMTEVQQLCDRVAVISDGVVVAENTVAELRGHRQLQIAAEPAAEAARVLASLPEVASVHESDGVLRVAVDEAGTPDVVRALVDAGVAVREVRRSERELEDVFFEITERRDPATATIPTNARQEASHV